VKQIKYTALLSMLALLLAVSAFAGDKNRHSVDISETVQVGNTQLNPGSYRVEWQGTGPEVQVNFVRYGKTVATAPGKFTSANTNAKTLKEIDFSHNKESLVFEQSGM
jgi:hypothetical protein